MKHLNILLIIGALLLTIWGCGPKSGQVKETEMPQDPTTLLSTANQLFRAGQTSDAFRLYGEIYERYPTSREYIDAVIGMSRCYNEMGDYDSGMKLLYDLIRENIVPSRVPLIYNEIAKYYETNAGISSVAGISEESEDYRKAISFYEKAVNYPNSDDVNAKAYAQYRIAELQLALMNFKDAALSYQMVINNFPDTEWATRAKTRMEEFQAAVNTVLNELKQEKSYVPLPEPSSTTPEQPMETVPAPADTTTKEVKSNSPENTPVSAPQDTTAKPKMELK